MEGDFRRPLRQPNGFAGGRPHPQAGQRPAPVTDLRPAGQQAVAAQPPNHPRPQFAQSTYPAPSVPAQPEPPAPARPAPTTAELIARHERETSPQANTKRNLVIAVVGLVIVMAVALVFAHRAPAKSNGPLPPNITASQVTIPVYSPKNLPAGFKVSGYKVVKQDVLNYVVTNSNNDSFYVNIQPIPAGYDFNSFNKRFTSPNTYPTPIGSATSGIMNNQLICSIVTSKSWVMINTAAVKDTADMSTIAKALQLISI
ncbi:MAG TPA: hypothetical protein VFH37_02330 [Candidatus Saccharimonadales bacterium]|nr:hypothetical protein [Candidatus Saccharimonadales bacterium]